ncbi:MAG: Structural maintenance of chromosomes protein 5 [Thelocarpon superellum]|nr:MAG: Structural maintenance of chromosomes protein 5 [Thelocarpon superellum]
MPSIPLRRPRPVDPDHLDSDDARSSSYDRATPPRSSSSKRARASLNGHASSAPGNRGVSYGHDSIPGEEHQPGSIVRVKLQDFVTYTSAEFFPGPSLNMVIGPNGTGKSTLVCAICLGLGWGPQHLGRAKDVSEYVKHGCQEATIEIELARMPGVQAENPVIRRHIKREGNKSQFSIDGKPSTLKGVLELARCFSIQIDNLCQFLPQDKVCEFAALTPVELLHSTQRAAAPEIMIEMHDSLKVFRAEQKKLQAQQTTDRETLSNLEGRQHMLQADVARLKERTRIQERVVRLEKTRPFVAYREARRRNQEAKQRKKDAQTALKALEDEVEPSLRAVNAKQDYRAQVDQAYAERKRAVERADAGAGDMEKKHTAINDKINDLRQEIQLERTGDKDRRQEIARLEGKMKNLERQMKEDPVDFDAPAYNEQIRERTRAVRQVGETVSELRDAQVDLARKGKGTSQRILRAEEELKNLDSQAGQQGAKLRSISRETANAWDWIRENQDVFEHRVFGPAVVECSVKDPKYVNLIESLFRQGDFLAFTTQSRNDYRILSDKLYRDLKLADITIRCCTSPLETFRPPVPPDRMRGYGFEGWALDYLVGPAPVLAMLCSDLRINQTGVAYGDISDRQYETLQDSPIFSWVTAKATYQITRRREYGPGATSTRVRDLTKASVWTDQPVDVAAKRELQDNIHGWRQELEEYQRQIDEAKRKTDELLTRVLSLDAEKKELEEEKAAKQRAKQEFEGLPTKHEYLQEQLRTKQDAGAQIKVRLLALNEKIDQQVLEKARLARDFTTAVEMLQVLHQDLTEMEMMQIEAISDLEVLTSRNREVKSMLEAKRDEVEQVAREADEQSARARALLNTCKEVLADEDHGEVQKQFMAALPDDQTGEDLENEIESEKARLELVHEGNPNAIAEFDERGRTIERLGEKVRKMAEKLEGIGAAITEVREKWEPRLDELVQSISDAFSHNFEKIGCAGQVGIHKDEDFDQWAIQIQVKFRENEPLSLLTSHRQSGGERAVSTIFYLMSLQSLARAPFRVVDEINQGMDPRNERVVHERMVDIACQEHTSQYFLITPKLLHGLRYHPRMKVLCIASGEYMPDRDAEGGANASLLDFRHCVLRKTVLDGEMAAKGRRREMTVEA